MSSSWSLRLRSLRPLPAVASRYGLAVVAVLLALLLVRGLELVVVKDAPSALLVAVAAGALYGGIGPGLVALALIALVTRDPGVVLTGALLAVVCGLFRRTPVRRPASLQVEAPDQTPTKPAARVEQQRASRPPFSVKPSPAAPPLLEVTTEATWRFHHEQPLDITLPEDEQVEHLYLYSVLAECNDAFARMYGFRSAADVIGTRLVVFLPPSNPENIAYLRTFIRSGYRLEDAESREIDRYGNAKCFVNNLVGIFERGQLVGAWGTQRDITDARISTARRETSPRIHSSKSSSQ